MDAPSRAAWRPLLPACLPVPACLRACGEERGELAGFGRRAPGGGGLGITGWSAHPLERRRPGGAAAAARPRAAGEGAAGSDVRGSRRRPLPTLPGKGGVSRRRRLAEGAQRAAGGFARLRARGGRGGQSQAAAGPRAGASALGARAGDQAPSQAAGAGVTVHERGWVPAVSGGATAGPRARGGAPHDAALGAARGARGADGCAVGGSGGSELRMALEGWGQGARGRGAALN